MNHLPADDSHEIASLILLKNLGYRKICLQNLSNAVVTFFFIQLLILNYFLHQDMG